MQSPYDVEIERFAEVVGACLAEAGRPDLGMIALIFRNDDGTMYIELADDDLLDGEIALIEKAERLAHLDWLKRTP